jgi:hypothetical protein
MIAITETIEVFLNNEIRWLAALGAMGPHGLRQQ